MTKRDLNNIFSVFVNQDRFNILLALHKSNKLTYTELKKLAVDPTKTSFAYNMLQIKHFNLVTFDYRTRLYDLSCIGKDALDLAIQLTKIVRHIEDTEEYGELPACLKLLPPIYVSKRKMR